MSQRDLTAIGIEQARFSRLINGKADPSAAEVVKIAHGLLKTPEDVLRGFGLLEPAPNL